MSQAAVLLFPGEARRLAQVLTTAAEGAPEDVLSVVLHVRRDGVDVETVRDDDGDTTTNVGVAELIGRVILP